MTWGSAAGRKRDFVLLLNVQTGSDAHQKGGIEMTALS
jgi:hypothetical protein